MNKTIDRENITTQKVTSAPIWTWEVKLEITTDRPTDRPTNQPTDRRTDGLIGKFPFQYVQVRCELIVIRI